MKIFSLFLTLFIVSVSTNATESVFDGIDGPATTEADEINADNYIHQGIAQERYQEMCADDKGGAKDICNEDKYAFDGGMRKLEAMLPALTTAYAMFSTMGGGGKFTSSKFNKDSSPKIGKDGEQETEEKPDYCGYIAMVSEAANVAYTALQNDKSEQNFLATKLESRQAASFYALADSHKSMAKGAKVQFGVWTATAACYVAYAVQAQYTGDWKVWAKLAAAGFIATYYKKKSDAHEDRVKLLTEMAKDLPQAGECNPYTNPTCFCAEDSSFATDPGNYSKYCSPKELANRNIKNNDAYVCVDQQKKPDPQCNCVQSNTCVDKRLKMAGINLGLSPLQMKDPLAAMRPITKGFGGAGVTSAANRNLALAKKTLKKFKPKKGVNLNPKQKDIAASLFNNGISKAAAAYLSRVKSKGASLPRSATAGFGSGNYTGSKGKINQIAAISPRFQKGKSIRSGSRKRSNPFGKFGKKRNSKNTNSIQIEDFAKKAEREAEINIDTSKGIFDIISYRYKMSAWREFHESMEKGK